MAVVPLVIVGAGGFAREVLDVVEAMDPEGTRHRVLGFLADDVEAPDLLAARGHRLLGPSSMLSEVDAEYVLAIGSVEARRRLDALATAAGRRAATLVHPAATFGRYVELGPGTIVTAGCRLTNNIRLGRHVLMNLNTTVGHDARIDDHVTLNPGVHVSGAVHLADRVFVGTGAVVLQGLSVGVGATVGAGAVVVRDVPAGVTAVGVPAKPLSRP